MQPLPLPPPPRPLPRRPQDGEVIVHGDRAYLLGRELGRGYFGEVFACWDIWDNELAAKVLTPHNHTVDEVRQSWLNELGTLVHLRHPNITYIYDAFEYDGAFYMIMEQCSSTLELLLGLPNIDGELWLPHVARDLLQAVSFIHSNNYVHKDIHAGNVFIKTTYDRMVHSTMPVYQYKLGDFGISRLESDINIFGTMMAQWMKPPEFINPAQFGSVSRVTDIYHVGLILLSLLLGKTPTFSDQDILAGEPRKTAEQLSSVYTPAIARALRRHISERTPSAIQFWQDINAARRASNGS